MIKKILLTTLFCVTNVAYGAAFTANMVDLQSGKSVGHVEITESRHGMVFTPSLSGIRVRKGGTHGFHVHENPSCAPSVRDGRVIPGGAAGDHYDPDNTDRHGHPWTDNNHRGDLPQTYIDDNGQVTMPVLAPRLKPADFAGGRSLMIHVGGDNYSDTPALNGGGGARMICGVIKPQE